MKWFKFYGQDYLTDPKMKTLSVECRQCWIVLMCMANGEDKGGKVKFVDENEIMRMAGIEEDGQPWHETIGFIELFRDLEMIIIDNEFENDTYNITLVNYGKRQGEAMTPYERVKKYREKRKKDDNGASLSKRYQNVINSNQENEKLASNLNITNVDNPKNTTNKNNNDNAPSLSNRFKPLQNVIKNEANDNDDNENDNARLDKIRIDKEIYKEKDRSDKSSLPIFLGEFNGAFKTTFRETEKRKKLLSQRLKTYSLEEILTAVRKMSSNDFYQGKNDTSWRADPDYILRSDEQIDKFLNQKEKEKYQLTL